MSTYFYSHVIWLQSEYRISTLSKVQSDYLKYMSARFQLFPGLKLKPTYQAFFSIK